LEYLLRVLVTVSAPSGRMEAWIQLADRLFVDVGDEGVGRIVLLVAADGVVKLPDILDAG